MTRTVVVIGAYFVPAGYAGELAHAQAAEILRVGEGHADGWRARRLNQPVVLVISEAQRRAIAEIVARDAAGRAVAQRSRRRAGDDRLNLIARGGVVVGRGAGAA